MIVDLSHPLIMLTGENGCGKSTLLHAIYYALRGDEVDGYIYKLEGGESDADRVLLFDAEQHNPRTHLELFDNQPEMKEFVQTASHGQVMLSLFRETFPSFPNGTVLLLDEPEMALSTSNQRRILKMLMELVDQKTFPHRRGHAFAGLDRGQGNIRDRSRSSHQPECHSDRPPRGRSEHNSIGLCYSSSPPGFAISNPGCARSWTSTSTQTRGCITSRSTPVTAGNQRPSSKN